ncbi:MAG: 50S ribosomal protein L24 [Thaumarchaeota archaeon]|nr:50S ribosomal protein L24 [Nitrososphaerota archaeon]
MKPTKIRNHQLYRASFHVLSKQLGSHLSKDLRQKYDTRSIRVTVGDTVRVLRGEYKGVDGKVKEVNTLKNAVTIEGIKKEKLKGGQFDVYIHSSNLLVTELNTGDKWRIQKLEGTKSKSSKQKDTKPKEATKPKEELKPKVVEEKQKEPQKAEPKPKQEPKTKPIAKTPKTKTAPKKPKKELKEKKDEK